MIKNVFFEFSYELFLTINLQTIHLIEEKNSLQQKGEKDCK